MQLRGTVCDWRNFKGSVCMKLLIQHFRTFGTMYRMAMQYLVDQLIIQKQTIRAGKPYLVVLKGKITKFRTGCFGINCRSRCRLGRGEVGVRVEQKQ